MPQADYAHVSPEYESFLETIVDSLEAVVLVSTAHHDTARQPGVMRTLVSPNPYDLPGP